MIRIDRDVFAETGHVDIKCKSKKLIFLLFKNRATPALLQFSAFVLLQLIGFSFLMQPTSQACLQSGADALYAGQISTLYSRASRARSCAVAIKKCFKTSVFPETISST